MNNYFDLDGVNWSSLKLLDVSALAYKHALDNGRKDTPSMAMGRVTHTLVFEPELFGDEYAIWDGGRRGTNAYKEFALEHEGKTIFKPSELEVAKAMAAAVRRHPLVQPYLDGGIFEHVIRWTESEFGIDCKAKIDWLRQEKKHLIDLKTAESINERRFAYAAAKYGYHGQMAHYSDGVEKSLGWKPEKVVLVVVEKKPPYDVGVFVLDPDTALYAGEEMRRDLLKRLVECREKDEWPGRYNEEQDLELPGWAFGDDPEEVPLAD